MKNCYSNMRGTFKVVLLLLLSFSAIGLLPELADAQLNVTDIVTAYGIKNYYPATTSASVIDIIGTNFPGNSRTLTVGLEKKVTTEVATTWTFVRNLSITFRSNTKLSVNIGSAAVGNYRVYVHDVGNNAGYREFTVVPNATKLETYINPVPIHPGSTILLYGNLLPVVNTRVVLTPPTGIASWMGVREIVPTSHNYFYAQFTLPTDLWGGTWQVSYKGLVNPITEIATNKLPMEIVDTVTPKYSVQLYSFKCNKQTNDWSWSDEVYGSMIAFNPTHYGNYSWGSIGLYCTNMFLNVTTGQVKYPTVGMDILGNGAIGREDITDPSQAYYIIGLGECDNYWVNGGQWDASHGVAPDGWGEYKAELAVISQFANGTATDPFNVANQLKNQLATGIAAYGDECIGTKVVTWSKTEMYNARLTGQPVYKTFTFTEDSSNYSVTVRLFKTN